MEQGICRADGCAKPVKVKSQRLCGAHAMFLRNHGDLYVSSVKRVCAGCGETKGIGEMRHRGAQRRGSMVAKICQSCRDGHPGQHWCNNHAEFHPLPRFTPSAKSASGLMASCRAYYSEQMAGNRDPIVCPACRVEQHFSEFTGASNSRGLHPCRTCRSTARADEDWCGYCSRWLPLENFTKRGGQVYLMRRCKLCRTLANHHVELGALLALNGTDDFRCGICGTTDSRLCIDHDHSCCPGVYSCGRCVAGILCIHCNLIEGKVLTEDRATALLKYIRRKVANSP